jgi:putative SOS response-associated peptidase YedK
MCGRYKLSRRKQVVEEYFGSVSDTPDWNPRYNIAPTQPIPVIDLVAIRKDHGKPLPGTKPLGGKTFRTTQIGGSVFESRAVRENSLRDVAEFRNRPEDQPS